MNTDKVRIYELSRELNLDNKDILAICERLNISVKSHSSTITESEAVQIRSAASNYVASGSTVKKVGSSKRQSVSNKSANGARPPVKKQQILEIRRHRNSATPPKPPGTTRSPEQPAAAQAVSPATPPKKNDENALTPPPNRQEEAIGNPPPEPVVSSSPEIEASPPQPARPTAVSPNRSQAPTPPKAPKAEAAPAPQAAPKPTLVKPPARPVAKAPKPQAPSAGPPIVKKERVSSGDSEQTPKSSRVKRPVQSDQRIPIREVGEEPVPPKPKQVPELRRPKLVKSPSTAAKAGEDAAEADKGSGSGIAAVEPIGAPVLKYPSPSRTQKRKGKEEEDDEQEQRPKSGKSGAKGKRRMQPILLDEDDLDEMADQGSVTAASTALSISIARPPKPKSKPGQTKTPAATVAPKGRRSGGSNESSKQRRDRREQAAKQERPEKLSLTTGLTVHELAEKMLVPDTDIIKTLFIKGIVTNVNQTLDIPTIKLVAEDFGVEIETTEAESEARKVTEMLDEADLESLQRRPPVVTIMGHVDHGKTTLLDAIRKTKVAQGEAGGITQHIGAYHVDLEHEGNFQQIVFLDTPGHEAFTAMRARGARVTDIAILVVAADDGVRPQTIEAISHAKAAKVPIVVAINKVDKESAQPDRVKQELMEHALVPEEWGGDTIMVPVSALSGENLDGLLEMLLLVSEVEDLKANPDRLARGTVIEANLDKSRGAVATFLIQNGTLRIGDSLVVGSVFGKVRAMIDDRGNRVQVASPSFAVEVLGLSDVPAAGDEFEVFADEKEARSVASARAVEQRQSRLQQAMASRRVTLNTLSAQAQEGELKELNLVLKADVQGSVEAILGALQQLPQDEVQIRVLLAAPGEITETDVDLAAASSAVIIGFNTTLAPGARQAADRVGVDVQDYEIIYKLLEDVQGAMEGLLEPELVEEPLGQVDVRAVFPLRRGSVAGCYVLSGKVTRNCHIRVVRNGEVIFTGDLDSLKRMKEDVKEVNAGFECGIAVDGFNGWTEGDTIDAFRLVTKRRTLAMA
ncbi:MAG: translation initiation factor IF-2 [Leptolyngbyaceae cyanobacterium MO_188.B28]|nr:translation initiation factor IF-2 [Leptolyngbyaceae cyanobacterium MO_188.B28]